MTATTTWLFHRQFTIALPSAFPPIPPPLQLARTPWSPCYVLSSTLVYSMPVDTIRPRRMPHNPCSLRPRTSARTVVGTNLLREPTFLYRSNHAKLWMSSSIQLVYTYWHRHFGQSNPHQTTVAVCCSFPTIAATLVFFLHCSLFQQHLYFCHQQSNLLLYRVNFEPQKCNACRGDLLLSLLLGLQMSFSCKPLIAQLSAPHTIKSSQ